MSAISNFLDMRAAFGLDRAIVGAGRSVLRRLPPASRSVEDVRQPVEEHQASLTACDHGAVVQHAGSTFSVREGTWDSAIARETIGYLDQLQERGLMNFKNVIDIGGHIGGFSIHLARHANVSGSIYVIEPLKSNFDLIRENIQANGFDAKIIPIYAAASFREGSAILNIIQENTGGHYLSLSEADLCERVRTLDIAALFDSIEGPVDLLKIDCEGWEFSIFKRLKTRLHKIKAIVGKLTNDLF